MTGKLEIGSIWRERDARFNRFVRVERINCGDIMDPRAQIRTCDEFGRSGIARTTLAKHSAFGKRYNFISAPLQNKEADA